MTTPYWVQDAIFYEIFPDRFANGDPDNDPPNVQPWGSPPTIHGFQGGDLRGILRRFDYLLELGVTALYLTPIFQASSTHRYNTTDYFKIDPKLGNLDDFHALLDAAHRNNVRVILDGVFNHCGRGFFAFSDVLENGENSPYKDWFHIQRFPLEAYTPGEAENYLAWWKFKSLPKFNTDNPQVRQYILDVARYWIEQGIDGWRLDVPNEIDDDTFWEEFRHVVKFANRDAYLVGEIWTADPHWANDSHFDGLMNYPLRDALLRLLYAGTLDMPHFVEKAEGLLKSYPRQNVYAMYLPLGSHDTERLFTKVERSTEKAKLAFLFQFAYPGAPALYYGDEIGLEGEKDPEWAAGRLKVQKERGAQGLKIWKGFGLHVKDHSGNLVDVDDLRLVPIWETAGELGLPVLIHVADPAAFFDPLDESNERWEELGNHPDWAFTSPPFPPFMHIMDGFASLVTRHPNTTFIGAHVGCYAENLGWVGALLDRCPNFHVDISARIGELGRQPYTARRFFLQYADRILFGSDMGPYPEAYRIIYRFLETDDEYFNYNAAPIPMQGRWHVHGLYLPDDVLEKFYFRNAQRILQD